MKIIQLLPELNEGGVERGTVELNRELVKKGIESVVISAGGKLSGQIENDGGRHITFDACGKNVLTTPTRMYALRKILRQLEPDVVHARSRVPAWLTYLANKKLHIPFVTTVHGFNSVNAYSKVMTYGDHVICVSGAIKDYVQKNYQVPDEKITIIPRGIDLDLFNPDNLDSKFIEQFRQQFDLQDKVVVTSVGRITQLKDFETFIKGIALAKEKIPNICGLIVGGVRQDKHGYFDQLKALVRELNISEHIKFTGSQKNIAEIYSLSDVVAICSKKPESFGRTAAEALAMNVPVIATNHGGVLDIVLAGDNGCLIRTKDEAGLAEAIAELRGRYIIGRDDINSRFSLDSMLQLTIEVYNSLKRID